jgi:chromosome segregation ATPase
MENKKKIIVIAAAAVFLLIIFFIILSSNVKAKTLKLERDQLANENTALTKKVEDTLNEARRLKEKIDSLNNDLVKLSREKEDLQLQRDDFQNRYDVIAKERNELKVELSRQPAPAPTPAVVQQEVQIEPQDSYWAGILKSKVNLELQLDKAQNALKDVQIKNEELQRGKNSFTLDMNNISREKKDLEQQLQYTQKMFYNMSSELVLEKNMKNQLKESLQSLKNENSSLRKQLKSLSNRKVSLEKKFSEVQAEKITIESRFNEMALLLEDKLSNMSELREQLGSATGSRERAETQEPEQEQDQESQSDSVELSPIVVRPQGDMPKAKPVKEVNLPPRRGRVLEINKDSNFVIIDLGEEAGAKLGSNLKVYRDDKAIADIEIIEVRNKISACDIKKQSVPVKEGDDIR